MLVASLTGTCTHLVPAVLEFRIKRARLQRTLLQHAGGPGACEPQVPLPQSHGVARSNDASRGRWELRHTRHPDRSGGRVCVSGRGGSSRQIAPRMVTCGLSRVVVLVGETAAQRAAHAVHERERKRLSRAENRPPGAFRKKIRDMQCERTFLRGKGGQHHRCHTRNTGTRRGGTANQSHGRKRRQTCKRDRQPLRRVTHRDLHPLPSPPLPDPLCHSPPAPCRSECPGMGVQGRSRPRSLSLQGVCRMCAQPHSRASQNESAYSATAPQPAPSDECA